MNYDPMDKITFLMNYAPTFLNGYQIANFEIIIKVGKITLFYKLFDHTLH